MVLVDEEEVYEFPADWVEYGRYYEHPKLGPSWSCIRCAAGQTGFDSEMEAQEAADNHRSECKVGRG